MIVWTKVKPWDSAASNYPFPIAFNPPLTISDNPLAQKNIKVITIAWNAEILNIFGKDIIFKLPLPL